MLIATEPFVALARKVADEFGQADLAILSVPHPLGTLDQAEVMAMAAAAGEALVELLEASGDRTAS